MTDDTPSKPPARSHGRLSIRATTQPRALIDDQPAVAGAFSARVITLFPETFPGVLGASLTGKALADGRWHLTTTDLRRFGEGKHRNVDDTPAGGGAGMVLRADVVARALADAPIPGPVVCLTPRGRPFTQATAARWADGPGLTLLCGRFEGIDQRVIDHFEMEEVSLGDYVLTGGEIAAQAMLDATVRLLPGVLGNAASTEDESFAAGLLEHPHYTRPATWMGHAIPEVLLSGDHQRIAAWRQAAAEEITRTRRPDLLAKLPATDSDE